MIREIQIYSDFSLQYNFKKKIKNMGQRAMRKLLLRVYRTGIVAHTYNPSTIEAETRVSTLPKSQSYLWLQ